MSGVDRMAVWRQREADRKATQDAEWRKRVHNRHPAPTQGLGSPRGPIVVSERPAEPVDDVEPIDLDEIEE